MPAARGVRRREAREQAQDWLDRVGVGELADRRPGRLSGGQAQRVAVARALAAEPRLLLLDEPMAALDVDVAPAMRQTLRTVLADRTVLLVTHDVLDALLLADRVVVLEAGRVVEEGAGVGGPVPSAQRRSRPGSPASTWSRARGPGPRCAASARRRGARPHVGPGAGRRATASSPRSGRTRWRSTASAVEGSPRNSFAVTVTGLEPLGDLVRVRADAGGQSLAADVTVQSVAALELAAGQQVTFTVKATEVAVYRL